MEEKPLHAVLTKNYASLDDKDGLNSLTFDSGAPSVDAIPGIIQRVRKVFETDRTKSVNWRRAQIQGILSMMKEQEAVFEEALRQDLGATQFWTHVAELPLIVHEAQTILHNLSSWTSPTSVGTPLLSLPAKSYLMPEPYGVALIIAPWNYPLSLALLPVLAAVAAGNAVILKPSEVSSHCSAALSRLLPRYVDSDCVLCIPGAVPETTELLRQKFDIIMYTGNGHVAKIVMRAAAEHLTPVILELGGKCPAIVTKTANLKLAAKRIAWGKWAMNHGQTCVSPDYVMVDVTVLEQFVKVLKDTVVEFFGEDPRNCPDLSRIVNAQHTRRLGALLQDDPTIEVVLGGDVDPGAKFVSPTIVRAKPASKVMQDEIFGPILPVLSYISLADAISYVNEHDKPLALYLFSDDKYEKTSVLGHTSSGGCCINDVVMHVANLELPFGGIGGSGMGAYHGKHGFDAFSHMKPVMEKFLSDPSLRFPPYSAKTIRQMQTLMKWNGSVHLGTVCWFVVMLILVAAFCVLVWRAALSE